MKLVRTLVTGTLAVTFALGCRPRPSDQERRAEPEPAAPPTQATTQAEAPAPSEPVGVAETHGANLPPFEGQIDVKVQGKTPEALEYAMKGDKIRLGIAPSGKDRKGVDAIIDTDDQKATVLLNDRKQFVEVDLGKLAAKAKQRAENVDVERTGKTSTVNGRSCEEWKIKDKDYTVDACVMKGAPYFDLQAIEEQANFTAPAWVHRVVDEGYVPLKVTVNDTSGKSLGSSQISDASRKVDESQFEVPKGYQKTDASKLAGEKKK